MRYLGDFVVGGKVSFLWPTHAIAGESITRATDGTLKIFKAHATAATWATERASLAGVTQLEDFDTTGMHSVYIDLSDNTDAGFYAAGNEYHVAIVGAVVDGKTVNVPLAQFSIERAGGVASILARLPASLVSGRIDASVGAMAANVVTSTAINDGALTAAKFADACLTAAKFASGAFDAVWTVAARLLTAGTNIVLAKGTGVTGFNDIAAGAAMTLTSDERTAVANEVEAQIIDETDSEKVLEAITNKIAAVNPDLSGLTLSAIASAVWASGTRLLTAGTNIVLAKGVGVTGFTDLSAAAVRAEADAALASYDGPTNAEMIARTIVAADYATAAGVALVKAQTDNLPSDPADQSLIIAATNAITAAIAALNNLSSAGAQSAAAAALAAYDPPTRAEATTDKDAVIAAVPTAVENADALLDRDMATGVDSGSTAVRTARQALRFLRNKWAISSGTLTVCKEDDATTSWTSALGSQAGAAPVISSDPAGP